MTIMYINHEKAKLASTNSIIFSSASLNLDINSKGLTNKEINLIINTPMNDVKIIFK